MQCLTPRRDQTEVNGDEGWKYGLGGQSMELMDVAFGEWTSLCMALFRLIDIPVGCTLRLVVSRLRLLPLFPALCVSGYMSLP